MFLASASTQVSHHLTYFEAIVIGIFQGITELFPVSSLGHTVLIPQLFGWHNIVKSESASESFYLAFVVGLHVANALLSWSSSGRTGSASSRDFSRRSARGGCRRRPNDWPG